MPVGRGGGGHGRRKKLGDCNSFTLSRVQGAWPKFGASIGRSEIHQGTGASFKFQLIDKLTPPHKRSR